MIRIFLRAQILVTYASQGCKTKSLSAPFTMNPLTCVSFINTFGDGNLPDGVTEDMLEEWIIGCDNCQDSCPFNKNHDWSIGKTILDLMNWNLYYSQNLF